MNQTIKKQKILLINGPNLNLLGKREPHIYGNNTLTDIIISLKKNLLPSLELIDFQSNHEGKIIDFIHQKASNSIGIIINPGAFAHTSIALRDALLGVEKPYIEVHLSNVNARESFRQKSFLADKAEGIITGLGELSYKLALDYATKSWIN